MGDKHRRRTADDVEADVRKAMAKHAAIRNRGFDTAAQRERLHRVIDDLLDEHALLQLWEDQCDDSPSACSGSHSSPSPSRTTTPGESKTTPPASQT